MAEEDYTFGGIPSGGEIATRRFACPVCHHIDLEDSETYMVATATDTQYEEMGNDYGSLEYTMDCGRCGMNLGARVDCFYNYNDAFGAWCTLVEWVKTGAEAVRDGAALAVLATDDCGLFYIEHEDGRFTCPDDCGEAFDPADPWGTACLCMAMFDAAGTLGKRFSDWATTAEKPAVFSDIWVLGAP